MKRILLALVLLCGCRDTYAIFPATSGQLTVYVHWEAQPLPDKQIELVQTQVTLYTDSSGRVAFTLPAGEYTVRAYAINRGGPAPRSIDFSVRVRAGEMTLLDIVDCLPCL